MSKPRKRKGAPRRAPHGKAQQGDPSGNYSKSIAELREVVQEQEEVFADRLAQAESLDDLTVTEQVEILEGLIAYATQLPTIRKLALYRVIEKQVGLAPDVLKKCEEEYIEAIAMWKALVNVGGVSNDYH